MADIEWEETHELKPKERSLREFCLEYHISWEGAANPQGPIVFVEREALAGMEDFVGHELKREHGGVLAGCAYYDPGENRYFAVLHKAIPAQESEGSSVHLQFTPETWTFISGILEEDTTPNLAVVGWFHSHPGLGVFMSGTDRGTQKAFFYHPWSVAVVVDPIAKNTGWFWGEDCQRLDSGSVIPYEEQRDEDQLPGEIGGKRGYRLRPSFMHMYRWLMPAVVILLFFLASAWLLKKYRF